MPSLKVPPNQDLLAQPSIAKVQVTCHYIVPLGGLGPRSLASHEIRGYCPNSRCADSYDPSRVLRLRRALGLREFGAVFLLRSQDRCRVHTSSELKQELAGRRLDFFYKPPLHVK